MGDQAHIFVVHLAKVIEFLGVAIIIGGIILAALNFIRDGVRLRDWVLAYEQFRSNLGRAILLGLELLVGRTSFPRSRLLLHLRAFPFWLVSSSSELSLASLLKQKLKAAGLGNDRQDEIGSQAER